MYPGQFPMMPVMPGMPFTVQNPNLMWKEFSTPEGKKYYHNPILNETVWTLPAGVVPIVAAPIPTPQPTVKPIVEEEQKDITAMLFEDEDGDVAPGTTVSTPAPSAQAKPRHTPSTKQRAPSQQQGRSTSPSLQVARGSQPSPIETTPEETPKKPKPAPEPEINLTAEEREAEFRALLNTLKLNIETLTWEKALPKMANDKRYRLIKNVDARKKVFNDWLSEKKEDLENQNYQLRKQNNTAFLEMLTEKCYMSEPSEGKNFQLNRSTRFSSIESTFSDDPRWKAIPDHRQREHLVQDWIDEERDKERERQKELEREKEKKLADWLLQDTRITIKMPFKVAQEILKDTPEWEALPNSSRMKTYNNHQALLFEREQKAKEDRRRQEEEERSRKRREREELGHEKKKAVSKVIVELCVAGKMSMTDRVRDINIEEGGQIIPFTNSAIVSDLSKFLSRSSAIEICEDAKEEVHIALEKCISAAWALFFNDKPDSDLQSAKDTLEGALSGGDVEVFSAQQIEEILGTQNLITQPTTVWKRMVIEGVLMRQQRIELGKEKRLAKLQKNAKELIGSIYEAHKDMSDVKEMVDLILTNLQTSPSFLILSNLVNPPPPAGESEMMIDTEDGETKDANLEFKKRNSTLVMDLLRDVLNDDSTDLDEGEIRKTKRRQTAKEDAEHERVFMDKAEDDRGRRRSHRERIDRVEEDHVRPAQFQIVPQEPERPEAKSIFEREEGEVD
ncbi:hypothetical protein BLNAU_18619 [Blattamonas nauphoetae]|uniref:WW domain-containing protein n=1 Tax=Blattamonas nauphoetae TaxID=2049346 RepID=A0ABQ9X3W7_9EUKA|nr:hypothetical protein BLNAU_18619 [Blattamonas nauphoetae]